MIRPISSGWRQSQAQYNCRAVRRPWGAINQLLLVAGVATALPASAQLTWQFELNIQPTTPHATFQFIDSGIGYGAGIVRTVHDHFDLAVTVGRVSLDFDPAAFLEVVELPEGETPIGGSSKLTTFHFELRASPMTNTSPLRLFGVLGIGGFVERRGVRGTVEQGIFIPSRSESGVLASFEFGAEYWAFDSVGLRAQSLWMTDANGERPPGRLIAYKWYVGLAVRGL